MNLVVFLWLGLSMCCFACGEIMSKKFANTRLYRFAFLNCLASVLSTIAWLPAITKHNILSVVGTIWSLLSVVITVVVGLVLFHEPITLCRVIGLILAFIAIVLLSI